MSHRKAMVLWTRYSMSSFRDLGTRIEGVSQCHLLIKLSVQATFYALQETVWFDGPYNGN